ncbi:MAG: ABC transporter permease [Actinobacteria bacterium]|nr:ABC transporter permease [Actinomycetota bacterium]
MLTFLRRDLSIEMSYRLAFLMRFFGIFFAVASFFFVSKLIGKAANPYLSQYGGDYFAFVLIGIALTGFQGTGLSTFSSAISSEQAQGTLEAMLVMPTRLSTIIFSSSVWNFLFTAFNILIYLAIGTLLFGADLGKANIPAALVVLVLTVFIFSGLGIISASVIMVLKRGDPINWLFGSLSSLLGGAFFPVAVLPSWLQGLSYLFPVFYSLRAMRYAVLNGAAISAISGDVLALALFSAVVLPLSIVAFKRAVGIAKTDGTLGTY